MARGGLKTPEPGRVTGRVGDGVGVSEADGGRGYSTLHCTGVMRSRERGKEESGGGEDEKQDKALRLSRGFTTHVWSAADVVCGAPADGEFGWRWAWACCCWATTLSTAGRADLHLPLPVEPA